MPYREEVLREGRLVLLLSILVAYVNIRDRLLVLGLDKYT